MIKAPAITLGKFLKEKRENAGLSQADVARELDYTTPQFVSNWERGLSSPPAQTLRTLVQMYKIPKTEMVDYLLSEQRKYLNSLFSAAKSSRSR